MYNWDDILMVMNYMFCNDEITYSWAGMGKYFFGGILVNILVSYVSTLIPGSLAFASFNDKGGKDERAWEHGWLHVTF